MGTLLLHNPWIHFYLLYVAALLVACIWDYLHSRLTIQDDSRAPQNEVTHGTPGLLPSASSQNPPPPVSRPGRRTDKEVGPVRGGRRPQAPADPTPAPSSRNRRKYHVVTP